MTVLDESLPWLAQAIDLARRDYEACGSTPRLARLLARIERRAGICTWISDYEVAERKEGADYGL